MGIIQPNMPASGIQIDTEQGFPKWIVDRLDDLETELETISGYGFVNVKLPPFNAPSNGVDPDDEAFAAAAALAKTLKVPVYAPSGEYKLTESFLQTTHNLEYGLVGDGVDQTILNFHGDGYVAINTRAASGVYRDFTVDGAETTNCQGIYFNYYGGRGHIKNVRVANFSGYGMKFEAIWDSVVENIMIESCGNASEYALIITGGTDTSNHTVFNRIQVEDCDEKAIDITATVMNCMFMNIHTERTATPTSGNSHRFRGYRCTYVNARIEDFDPTPQFGGENNSYTNVLVLDGTSTITYDSRQGYEFTQCYFFAATISNIGQPHFRSCKFPTLTIGGEIMFFSDCEMANVTLNFSKGTKRFTNCTITDIVSASNEFEDAMFVGCEFNKSAATYIELCEDSKYFGCDFNHDTRLNAKVLCEVYDSEFKAGLLINDNTANLKLVNCSIDGNLTRSGTNTLTAYHCEFGGSLATTANDLIVQIQSEHQADSVAATVADLRTDFNALIAKLVASGHMKSS